MLHENLNGRLLQLSIASLSSAIPRFAFVVFISHFDSILLQITLKFKKPLATAKDKKKTN